MQGGTEHWSRPVVIHDLKQARAAFAAAAAADVPLLLRSAPGAAGSIGAGTFRAIVETARRDYPQVSACAVLDCGDAVGLALGALRAGVAAVRLDADPAVLTRVADIAARCGARLDADAREALDLSREHDLEAACRRWLGGV